MQTTKDIANQVETLVRCTLDLGKDVELKFDSDLIDEIGLDSIEAYEAIAALHAILGEPIPKDLDPGAVRSVLGMANYVASNFSPAVIDRFIGLDVGARIAAMRSVDTLE